LNEPTVTNTNDAILTSLEARFSRNDILICIIAIIAMVAAMYLAQAFFLPLLIGILASYTLIPGGFISQPDLYTASHWGRADNGGIALRNILACTFFEQPGNSDD
jgi:hypothetical protein